MTSRTIHVLIAEDEAAVAALAAATLARCAHKLRIPLNVTTVASGTEAQTVIGSSQPHMLVAGSLTDAHAVSLWETWRHADAGSGPSRPCVLLGLSEAQEACVVEHGDEWTRIVAKPFSPPQLAMQALTLLVEAGVYRPPRRPAPRCIHEVVLDLCCGSGLSTCLAAEEAGTDALIVGVDRSWRAVREARRAVGLLGYRHARFLVADVKALPFADASIDAVHGTEDLAHSGLADVERARDEVRRVCNGPLPRDS